MSQVVTLVFILVSGGSSGWAEPENNWDSKRVAQLLAQMFISRSSVDPAARKEVAAFCSDPSNLPRLAELLGHEDWKVRGAVRVILKRHGEKALPVLLEILASKDWWLREEAAMVVGDFTYPAAVDALLKAAFDQHVRVRYRAVVAMGSLELDADRAVPVLLRILEEDSPSGPLVYPWPTPDRRPTDIVCLMGDPADLGVSRSSVVGAAVVSVSVFGAKAKAAVPALLQIVERWDEFRKKGNMDNGQDASMWASYRILAKCFGKIGPDAVAAVPFLTLLLESPRAREEAAWALKRIRPSTGPANTTKK